MIKETDTDNKKIEEKEKNHTENREGKKNLSKGKSITLGLVVIIMIITIAFIAMKTTFFSKDEIIMTTEENVLEERDIGEEKETNDDMVNDIHWIVDKSTGVYILNNDLEGNESVKWNGGYVEEEGKKYANGKGILLWYKNGEINRLEKGGFIFGRQEGQFIHILADGSVQKTSWYDGELKDKSLRNENLHNEEGARITFICYHEAISHKFYKAAYNMLSGVRQTKIGKYESYVKGYETTIDSLITSVEKMNYKGDDCSFVYILVSHDGYGNNRVKEKMYIGKASMIWDNNKWLINDASSEKKGESIKDK